MRRNEPGTRPLQKRVDDSQRTIQGIPALARAEAIAQQLAASEARVTAYESMELTEILAESAARYLKSREIVNYAGDVFTITADNGDESFEIVVTAQRIDANSPAEICEELKATITRLEAKISKALDLDYQRRQEIAEAVGLLREVDAGVVLGRSMLDKDISSYLAAHEGKENE